MGDGKPDLTKGLVLVGNKMCPFAQRAWFALEESGLAYTHCECQLYPKPKWLLDINPRGKVPVLVENGKATIESEVIVDLVASKVSLSDPDEERTAKWRKALNKELMPAGQAGNKGRLRSALVSLDELMLQRIFEDGRGGVPEECKRLHAWWAAISERPAFQKTKLDAGQYWWWW
eukprot:TRINITY_DN11008_c0_g3_i1.p1 TRINITY_DN11008_c0_g3~~TRINITY_DN11008_c0_g3_i1.p1  ORF type:complete len:175 (+),score=31.76 TRINITY_DN11008_c0_g3_i1:818-1342(+)